MAATRGPPKPLPRGEVVEEEEEEDVEEEEKEEEANAR